MTVEQDIVEIKRILDQVRAVESDYYIPATAWTPALFGTGTPGTFVYASGNAATYTRINDTVFFRGRVQLTSVTVAPTGNISITGLPITSATVTSNNAGDASFGYWSGVGLGGGAVTYLAGYILSAETQIHLALSSNNGAAAANLTGAIAGFGAGTDMPFYGFYQV